jgi:arylsulfatase A
MKKFRGQGKAGAYGEFMIETDWHLGRIMKWLDDEKLTDNTMVIFTSDNGPETTWKKRKDKFGHQSNGLFKEGKRSIYEGGHRVPFVIRYPNLIKSGSKTNIPVCQTDILATIAEMIGSKLPQDAGEDSSSFLSDLKGVPDEQGGILIHHSSNGRYAIRKDRWKLILPQRKSPVELYDLDQDPTEKTNLSKKHPDIVSSLRAEFSQVIIKGRSTPGKPQKNDTPIWPDVAHLVTQKSKNK